MDYRFLKSFLKIKTLKLYTFYKQSEQKQSINGQVAPVPDSSVSESRSGSHSSQSKSTASDVNLTGSVSSTKSLSSDSCKSVKLIKKIESFCKTKSWVNGEDLSLADLDKMSFQEVILLELNKTVEFGTKQKQSVLEKLNKLKYEQKKLELWQQSGFPDLEAEVQKLETDYIALGKVVMDLLDFIELNVVAIKKCLKKWDKLRGQQVGLSLLSRFEKTHLNSFLDIRQLKLVFIELNEGLKQCDSMIVSGKRPATLKIQPKLEIRTGRSIVPSRYRQN